MPIYLKMENQYYGILSLKKIIFETTEYVNYNPLYNKYLNSILLYSFTGQLVALNLSHILSVWYGEEIAISQLNLNYHNDVLNIKNLPLADSLSVVTIFDLNGKLIDKTVQPPNEDSIQIRVTLQPGAYILQIQIGDKQYSQKFITTVR